MTEHQQQGPVPHFLAEPRAEAAAPGIVVVMEGMGITQQLIRVCQRLAGLGYASIAPDLYHRAGGSDEARAPELFGGLQDDEVVADITWAAGRLRDIGAPGVSLVGFCSGGRQAYLAAARGAFRSIVAFYGGGIGDLMAPPCPVLLVYGAQDEHIDEDDRSRATARHPDDTVIYTEAGHAFLRDGSDFFRADAAADAWERMSDFLAATNPI